MNPEFILKLSDEAGFVQMGEDLSNTLFQGSYDEMCALVRAAMSEAFKRSAVIAWEKGWDNPSNNDVQCVCAEIADEIKKELKRWGES